MNHMRQMTALCLVVHAHYTGLTGITGIEFLAGPNQNRNSDENIPIEHNQVQ